VKRNGFAPVAVCQEKARKRLKSWYHIVTYICWCVAEGCEYGDRASWCAQFTELDCSLPDQRYQCCSTCASRMTSTSTTTTTPSTTTMSVYSSTADNTVNQCPLGDQSSTCSTMPSSDCYHYSDVCCRTCRNYNTGVLGKLSFMSWFPHELTSYRWPAQMGYRPNWQPVITCVYIFGIFAFNWQQTGCLVMAVWVHFNDTVIIV